MKKSSRILAGAVSTLILAGSAQIASATLVLQWDPTPDGTATSIGTGYTTDSSASGIITNSTLGINHGGPSLNFNDGTAGSGINNGIDTNRAISTLVGSDGSFTMAAFVNLASDQSGDDIVFGADVANPLHLGFRAGQIQFGFWSNDTTAGTAPADGAWHQIVFVYDGTAQTQVAYLDGVQAFSPNGGKVPYSMGGNLTIGTNGGNNKSDLLGNIGDVQVFNNALTASQVSSLFTADSQPAPEPATLGMLGVGAMGLLMRRRKAVLIG